MPVYEFQAVGGAEIIEKYYRAADAPELGATIFIGGRLYRRIISTSGLNVCVKEFAHVSHQLPRNCKGAPHYDAEGRPAFQSQKEVQEFCKREGFKWD